MTSLKLLDFDQCQSSKEEVEPSQEYQIAYEKGYQAAIKERKEKIKKEQNEIELFKNELSSINDCMQNFFAEQNIEITALFLQTLKILFPMTFKQLAEVEIKERLGQYLIRFETPELKFHTGQKSNIILSKAISEITDIPIKVKLDKHLSEYALECHIQGGGLTYDPEKIALKIINILETECKSYTD